MWSHLFEVFCCFTELKWKDKDGREQSKREGKIGNEEVGCVCVCVCACVCVTEESLHEQQLLGSLRALAGAGNHRSRPCSHALTVSVCECVWVCVPECLWEDDWVFMHLEGNSGRDLIPLWDCSSTEMLLCVLYVTQRMCNIRPYFWVHGNEYKW